MSTQSLDTALAVEALQYRIWSEMPAWRKLELVAEMTETVRALAFAGLRQRYPDALDDELDRHLADLILGPELAARVYGPLP